MLKTIILVGGPSKGTLLSVLNLPSRIWLYQCSNQILYFKTRRAMFKYHCEIIEKYRP